MSSYLPVSAIMVGDVVAPGGMFESRGVVTDVSEPSHGLAAAYGFTVLWVDYLNGYRPHPVTLAPDATIWRVDSV